MSGRYAVIGHPVSHSKSPWIHERFAEATGQDLEYGLIDAPADGFEAAVRAFSAAGGRGLNVTLPFKEAAFRFCEEVSERARVAQAVNTLVLGERVFGDNTDGAGLVRDLRLNRQATLKGSRVLLLGAGGAARGVLPALLEEKPALVHVANRTPERAEKLAERFCTQHVQGGGFETLGRQTFDLVINATSASLTGALPPLPDDCLEPHALCYDLLYSDRPTVFMLWAERQGAERVCDGWGMLVEQAAESFQVWRGVRPDTRPLIAAHRA